jgi:O-antigen/teichoic acid export membrane protein
MGEGGLGTTLLNRLARGSAAAFVIYVAGVGLTYCSQLLIARVVGAHVYGVYAYVFAWVAVLAYACALGFDVALLRFVPTYQAQQAWSLLGGVIQYAERRAAVIGLLAMLIGIWVTTVLVKELSPELKKTFLIGLVLVPVWAVVWIRCAVARAFGGVASALAPDRVVRDGLLVALVGFASFGLKWNIDAPFVMMATLVSSVVGLGFATLAIRRLRPGEAKNVVPTYAARTWRRAALPLVIIGATEALMNRTGVLLLGWMGDTTAAGIYGVAFNIAFLVAVPRMAVNTLFAPTISGLFALKERRMLQVLVTRAASWTLSGAAAIAVVIFIFAQPLLSWFGNEYVSGVQALRILLVGQVIAASGGSQLHVLLMTGHERSAAALLIVSSAVNAILGLGLISPMGLTGAAIATATTLIGWNMAMAFFVWRQLDLVPGVLGSFRGLLGTQFFGRGALS